MELVKIKTRCSKCGNEVIAEMMLPKARKANPLLAFIGCPKCCGQKKTVGK